jgi:hypothetical protein
MTSVLRRNPANAHFTSDRADVIGQLRTQRFATVELLWGIVLVWRAMSDLSAEPGTLSRPVAKALGRVRILRMRHPTDGTADSVLSPLAAARPGGCRWRGCVWFARDTIFGRRGPMLCCKCL